ncbi:MAG: hypothetical protein AMJ53_06275 [Gammaproteobacteria bacterium SG8_11]|nr:MAG: hypothetical protein AMJ53_06275 [Gammaproteobacteria bacterium SG8_11]
MIYLNFHKRITPMVGALGAVILCVFSTQAMTNETLWSYLAQNNNNLDLMDITVTDEQIFVLGVKTRIIPWPMDSTAQSQSLLPPSQRKLLTVLNAKTGKEQVNWRREYPSLPDASEIYSSAATPDHHLCLVYGGEYGEQSTINPLVLRLDDKGDIAWFKQALPTVSVQGSHFLPSEQIANLDAIKITAAGSNACLLALITRSVHTNSETFRLHLIRYDGRGHIDWHRVLPTGLYGNMYLLQAADATRHFIVSTNLSRDAALEAMFLGQPFVPQIKIATIDSEGNLLPNTHQLQSLNGAWLNNVIATAPDSLILIGKKRNAWLARIQSDGQLLNEYVDSDTTEGSYEYQAIVDRDKNGFIIAHSGVLRLFDKQMHLQATLNIADITTQSYENPNLSTQLPEDLAVEKLLPVSARDYLLFYKYGTRLMKIELPSARQTVQPPG